MDLVKLFARRGKHVVIDARGASATRQRVVPSAAPLQLTCLVRKNAPIRPFTLRTNELALASFIPLTTAHARRRRNRTVRGAHAV